jgi:hypothetical protein
MVVSFCAGAGMPAGEPQATNVFLARLEVQLGLDRGQSLGSLFEVKLKNGNVVFGAGFNAGAGTGLLVNNRTLEFYYKNGGQAQVEDLGKPILNSFRPSLLSIHNELLSFNKHEYRRYDGAGWKNMDMMLPGELLNIQLVRNRPLFFLYQNPENIFVLYERQPVVRIEGEICVSAAIYYQNVIYIAGIQEEDFVVWTFQWDPYDAARREATEIKTIRIGKSEDTYIYAMMGYKDSVIMAGSYGKIYRLHNNDVDLIYMGVNGCEFYCLCSYYDKLLCGQYPRGRLLFYDGKNFEEFYPDIPFKTGRYPYFEVQSLCVSRGNLFAGVYPWGVIWRFEPDSMQWSRVRLFTGPVRDSDEINPYEYSAEERYNAVKDVGLKVYPVKWLWNNAWGQRLSYMFPFKNGIAVVTGNMSGRDYIPELDTFLEKKDAEQYGRVKLVTLADSSCAQIGWREEKTVFEFRLGTGRMEIWQDNKKLNSQAVQGLLVERPEDLSVAVGQGIYGFFGGCVSDCRFFMDSNSIAVHKDSQSTRE